MSVTIDGPADFPALFRSADRESQRAQRSYLSSLRVRLGSLVVAAFGGALTLTTAGGFQVGGGLAFSPSLVRWAPSSFSRRPARSQRGTRVRPRQSRPRRSPGDTWCVLIPAASDMIVYRAVGRSMAGSSSTPSSGRRPF